MGSVKKIKEDFFCVPYIPFSVIGISSSLANFQIAYRMQQTMNCEFERTDDFICFNEKLEEDKCFDCLLQVDSLKGIAYMLLNNLSNDNTSYLIGNLRKMDYLLLVVGRDFASITSNLLKNIKGIKNVSYAQMFDTSSNKKSSPLKPASINSLSSSIEYFKDNNSMMSNFYV